MLFFEVIDEYKKYFKNYANDTKVQKLTTVGESGIINYAQYLKRILLMTNIFCHFKVFNVHLL